MTVDRPFDSGWLNGLDYMRVIALLLVVYQHFASNISQYRLPVDWKGLNAGQFGVALFCSISGFLALRKKKNHWWEWLKSKCRRIFPPYWMMLILAVAGNYLVNYKDVSPAHILMQFFGLSYFLPAHSCLNVATWYISLLLFCYATAFMILMVTNATWRILVLSSIMSATCYLLAIGWHVGFYRQVLTFQTGIVISLLFGHHRGHVILFFVTSILAVLLLFGVEIKYTITASTILLFFIVAPIARKPETIHFISYYSYEMFLMHGLFVVFFLNFLTESLSVSILATTLSTVISSVALKRAHRMLFYALEKR